MIALRKKLSVLAWPVTAMAFWLASWLVYTVLLTLSMSPLMGMMITATLAILVVRRRTGRWRQFILICGFLVSWLLMTPWSGLGYVPSWIWLLPLVGLLIGYPIQAWADAPLFPTPQHALRGLHSKASMPPGARIVDAGCGLGHGLHALLKEFPQAQLEGIERSIPLALICAWRCPWAKVKTADIWQADWSVYDMVYLFQRPESMTKAQLKARSELKPGAWLVSLEFEMEDCIATEKMALSHGKMVWLYQMPLQAK
jgi:hypothetical protein